ncbi:leucine-rich repeat-containing 2 [Labeo rohita]|uniref:Leucine-rich repeat-containing 2 n=2 Tax=Labeo rohita TaxID=84645 RepID=A0A498NEN5_LABRO|nr:leucine-rich repeat-containing 2 [Labeo rohita]
MDDEDHSYCVLILTSHNQEMSSALIHDKLFIKSFWETKINNHHHMIEVEEERMKKSALTKLRDEWLTRLENRTKHLKNFGDNRGANPMAN